MFRVCCGVEQHDVDYLAGLLRLGGHFERGVVGPFGIDDYVVWWCAIYLRAHSQHEARACVRASLRCCSQSGAPHALTLVRARACLCSFTQVVSAVLGDSETERLNFMRTLKSVMEKLLVLLDVEGFMPQYVESIESGVASFAGAQVDVTKLYEHMDTVRADKDERARLFDKCLIAAVDGSGTTVYIPDDVLEHLQCYCYWKSQYQLRWFIVTDMSGTILFVSNAYVGKMDDTTALSHNYFYDWLHRAFPTTTPRMNNETYRVMIGGDKGYFAVDHTRLHGAGVILTDTAVDAAAAVGAVRGNNKQARQAKFLAANAHAMLSPRFATHRSVVERVIGMMKRMSTFVAGPVFTRQHKDLGRVLRIVGALVNRQLSLNSRLFVRAPAQ